MGRNKTGVNTYASELYDDNGLQVKSYPSDYLVVTPDTLIEPATIGLYVGVSGDVEVVTWDQRADITNTVTFSNVGAGTFLWGRFVLVVAAGTTATNILAGV